MSSNLQSSKLLILGHGIKFISDNRDLIAIVSQLYPKAQAQSLPSDICIYLQPSNKHRTVHCSTNSIQFKIKNNTLAGKNGDSFCFANRNNLTGHIRLGSTTGDNPYLLRHQFINAISYFLLSYQYLTPIHCCAFNINNYTFICIGQSGAGKSNLAMAAMQHGLDLISEDLAFIANHQLYADCREIHLLQDSKQRFSQLKQLNPTITHNGKNKLIVPVSTNTDSAGNQLITVFLQPNFTSEQSELLTQSKALAYHKQDCFEGLYHPPEPGFNLPCQTRKKDIDWLSHQPYYICRLGNCAEQLFSLLSTLTTTKQTPPAKVLA